MQCGRTAVFGEGWGGKGRAELVDAHARGDLDRPEARAPRRPPCTPIGRARCRGRDRGGCTPPGPTAAARSRATRRLQDLPDGVALRQPAKVAGFLQHTVPWEAEIRAELSRSVPFARATVRRQQLACRCRARSQRLGLRRWSSTVTRRAKIRRLLGTHMSPTATSIASLPRWMRTPPAAAARPP